MSKSSEFNLWVVMLNESNTFQLSNWVRQSLLPMLLGAHTSIGSRPLHISRAI